jgi:hypothetical protein
MFQGPKILLDSWVLIHRKWLFNENQDGESTNLCLDLELHFTTSRNDSGIAIFVVFVSCFYSSVFKWFYIHHYLLLLLLLLLFLFHVSIHHIMVRRDPTLRGDIGKCRCVLVFTNFLATPNQSYGYCYNSLHFIQTFVGFHVFWVESWQPGTHIFFGHL